VRLGRVGDARLMEFEINGIRDCGVDQECEGEAAVKASLISRSAKGGSGAVVIVVAS